MTDYVISSGTTASYSVASGDVLQVFSAGISDGSRVISGGSEFVTSGGSSVDDRTLAGGLYVLDSGATASGVLIYAGGVLDMGDVQVAGGATLSLGVEAKAVRLSGVTVQSNGLIWSLDAEVTSNGREVVGSGGVALGTTVDGGGEELVTSGGLVDSATVLAGGVLQGVGLLTGTVDDSGVVIHSEVIGGGMLDVSSGGEASFVRVISGGVVDVATAGGLNSATLFTSAALTLEGEGLNLRLAGASVLDDGELLYTDAASARIVGSLAGSGSVVQDGAGMLTIGALASGFTGTVDLELGSVVANLKTALGTATVDFVDTANTATLVLGKAAAPTSGATATNALENFVQTYQQLDLSAVAFTSGATAVVSGSDLMVTDGAYTASFVLSGATAAGYVVENDGASGTLIHAAAAAGAPAGALVQAAASFGAAPGAGLASHEVEAGAARRESLALAPSALHAARA